ncbi:dipeptidyl aminopeptidase/acylaminoacyl peptidase [Evansella vedderi]|uniref:Dipeptidyl aminopeptidase/acylaminoacyl peptidase n=1 Tax=Evansella vedderi TaxID=38282 RepID=A0ABU0A215_9BACI|nr:alpha/beta fold hydrolase [Evansella vedderi]MDQ0257520.1 dipeptidyl aminopeptidase/acylaminoacyl peptidase [Evansella vedderi]
MNREVTFSSDVQLAGTLSIPENVQDKAPAILIIAGSGPTDRDGNMKKFQANMYKQLSEFFVSLGFITLRFDKRGTGKSEGKFITAGMWDLVEDNIAALNFLKKQAEVDETKVFVVGHSEGCLQGNMIASKVPIRGLVMLAGAGQSLMEATDYQREIAYSQIKELTGFKGFLIRKLNVIEKDRKKAKKLFDKMLHTDKDTIRYQFIKMNAKWFREHAEYDQETSFRKIPCPVLAITGTKDAQADYRALERLTSDVGAPIETHIIKDMNHILKIQEEPIDFQKLKKTYVKGFTKPLPTELTNILSKWLHEQI